MKRIDLTGQVFGMLTVVSPVKTASWLCRCECEDDFTCADCACYRCEHLHHCYGQCAKRGCAE